MRLYICFIFLLFGSCSGLGLKSVDQSKPQKIELSLIAGNLNVDRYKTSSRISVHTKTSSGDKKLTEKKFETSSFNLNRQTIDVDESGQATFKYWVTEVEGDVDLTNMGLPPQGKTLVEAVDKKARVLAVKDFPEQTIFYLPKIALPEKAVSPGDEWEYLGRWRSLKTGWPFEVKLNLKLKTWLMCGGLKCAHITYTGAVSLPEDSPLKQSVLDSEVVGEFVYAPVGHQFIWTYSKSEETFKSPSKVVSVDSCTASHQTSPDKGLTKIAARFKSVCN
jgi:hypothetical protein